METIKKQTNALLILVFSWDLLTKTLSFMAPDKWWAHFTWHILIWYICFQEKYNSFWILFYPLLSRSDRNISHRSSWAWAVSLLFSVFLNPPVMTSRTRLCHSCLSLCCMIYMFYIRPTTTIFTEFFIKPFYMVCSWMTSYMVCGKLSYSQALIFS